MLHQQKGNIVFIVILVFLFLGANIALLSLISCSEIKKTIGLFIDLPPDPSLISEEKILPPEEKCLISDNLRSSEYRTHAMQAAGRGELDCAIKNWQKVVDKNPLDTTAIANLAMLLAKAEQYEEAIPHFRKTIDLGAGAYDTFSWFATSLLRTGNHDEAIDWYYRALSVEPALRDITEELSSLLVLENRPYEAISLLANFGQTIGSPHYFDARIISILYTLEHGNEIEETKKAVKAVSFDRHFYLPARLNEGGNIKIFLVDTGASYLTFNESFLQDEMVDFTTVKKTINMKIADGGIIEGKLVKLNYFELAGHKFEDVLAVVCDTCLSLLGQNVLDKFDMQTKKQSGIDFLYLQKRQTISN